MPQRLATFEIGPYCSGGNHADVTTKFGRTIPEQRDIGTFHGSLRDFREGVSNPSDKEINEACEILLAVALRRGDPTGRNQVASLINSVTITLDWTNP